MRGSANVREGLRWLASGYAMLRSQSPETRNLRVGYYFVFLVAINLLVFGFRAMPSLAMSTTVLSVALSSVFENSRRLLDDANDPLATWYDFWKFAMLALGAVSLLPIVLALVSISH